MLERRQERGQPVPMLDNAPDVALHLTTILDLYWRMRRATAADHPIPLSEQLDIYGRFSPPCSEDRWLALVDACESEFCRFREEQLDRRRRQAEKAHAAKATAAKKGR